MTAVAADSDLIVWPERIDRALTGDGIKTVFQPIVDLQRGMIVGYEALARFAALEDGRYFGPDEWFAAAAALGATAQLDAVSLRMALSARGDLPRNCFLSVNVDPESLIDRTVTEVFSAHGDLSGLVIEITEHRAWDWSKLSPAVERLRAAGAIFAVDDAGSGYSGLQQILELRPSILKLDRGIVDGVDRDEAKRALIEMLGLFASRIDAWILAEGVETAGEAQTLIDLEVPLSQGFYFARPEAAWPAIDPMARTELRQIPRQRMDTLHNIVDSTPAAPWPLSTAQNLLHRDIDWVAVVDHDCRPLGLLNHETAVSGVLISTLTANVNSSVREVGQRLATSNNHEPHAPVIVVDNGGRYVGLLSMRRLIRVLSSDLED